MIWIILFAALSVGLLYTSLKTEQPIAKSGKDLSLDLPIGFYDAILGCETEVRIPRSEAISDNTNIQVVGLLKIMIPPGIASGSKLRLRGEGDASKNGGKAGDLFIQILAPVQDGEFQRRGLNIESEVAITKEQSYTGCDLVVKTIWGDLNIVVLPGTIQGDTMVLKGCGVPSPESPTKKGNHVIHFFCQEYEFNRVPTSSEVLKTLPEATYLEEGWSEGI